MDSNVLLDVATNDPGWGDWSARALAEVAEHTTLIINPVIYAEVSIGYTTIEALDAVLPATLYQREPLPWEAGFLAGNSFLLYRRRGGRGPRLCPISTLVRTLLSAVWHCSPVMPPVIAAIFRKSRSSLPQSAGCDSGGAGQRTESLPLGHHAAPLSCNSCSKESSNLSRIRAEFA